jgi:SRSO17 transposase
VVIPSKEQDSGKELRGCVGDYKTFEFILANGTKMEAEWDRLVREYHYLGLGKMIGRRVKYLVTLEGEPVAAISFNGGSYKLGVRDDYIGWDERERTGNLGQIVNNNRFLILPWVRIKNLASHLLSRSLRCLKHDWPVLYGDEVKAVETFVDMSRYKGTCYLAANWKYLGETKGYSKQGKRLVYHGRRKGVFFRIIDRLFAKSVRPRQTLKEKRWEMLKDMFEKPVWNEKIFEEAGLDTEVVQALPSMLYEYLSRFASVFYTGRQVCHFMAYVKGLISNAERKSIECFAKALGILKLVRPLQSFMRDSKWNHDELKAQYRIEAAKVMSEPDGMFTLDGCDIPKKGDDSAGVSRQYCGRLGKTDNCQASVMMGYSSTSNGYCLLDGRLYLPAKWFDDEYKKRRDDCEIPSSIKFMTKNEIAIEMLDTLVKTGTFQAAWVGVDAGFGNAPGFLDSIPEGLKYFAGVHNDQRVFVGDPGVYMPEYSGKGRRDLKAKTTQVSVTVKDIADSATWPWRTVCLGKGAKGPIIAREKCLRVTEVRDKLPGHEIWLYIREHQDGKVKYSLCNASSDTSLDKLRELALRRWPIEQCFEEGKDELGLDHYEGRSWNGWHRHIAIVFVAHLFLTILRRKFTVQSPEEPGDRPTEDLRSIVNEEQQEFSQTTVRIVPLLTLPMARKLLASAIMGSVEYIMQMIDNVAYTLKCNWRAYRSHRKRKLTSLWAVLDSECI